MRELRQESSLSPLALLALTVVVAGLGFVLIGPLVGVFLSIPFIDGNIVEQLPAMVIDPIGHPEFKLPLFVMQGSATLIGLGILPSVFWYSVDRKGMISSFTGKKIYGVILISTLLITISFMATNTLFIDWNAHLKFPSSMKGFESWARDYEDRAEILTKFLTQFSSIGEFLLAFVVIAVFPAFSEELVFRGMLQPQLMNITKNSHVAIWTSAILFSAFHLQFFGFVPRMLLGALFGYLYYWSGNLIVPMFAHFVNNGFSVVMLYLNQRGIVEIDMDSNEAAPWPTVLVFTLVGSALLYYFKKFFERRSEERNGN